MPKIDSIMHNSISVVDKVIDIDENTNTGNIEIRVSDANSDTLTVTVTSSNITLIPNDAANMSIDGVGFSVPFHIYLFGINPLILIIHSPGCHR
ncbi:MAG: hypothetical protein R2941_10065 [Desulfobacterales bacterium]